MPVGVAEEPAYTCAKCGGANPAYALNCQWCGATLRPPPLDFEANPPTIPFDNVPEEPEPTDLDLGSAGGGGSIRVRVVIAIAVLVVIVLAVLYATGQLQTASSPPSESSGSSYPVSVTVVELRSSNNVCDLNGTTEPGFHGVTSAESGQTWQITAPADGCTISSVSSDTAGIYASLNSLSSLSIRGGQTMGVGVSYAMEGLGGPYTGPLVLSVT